MTGKSDEHVAAIERAMVAIRRSQTRRTLARLAEEGGGPITTAAYDVLDVVEAAEQAGAPATVSGVAAALNVDQPRASKLVTMAVDAGLLRREADQADGRRSLLVRTQSGRAASDEVHRFRRSTFSAAMSGWSAAERAEFARLLTRFTDGIIRP